VILGGEPTLNSNLSDIILYLRKVLPSAKLVLRTNGFFLNRHPTLPSVLASTHTQCEITLHSDVAGYLEKYIEILDSIYRWDQVGIQFINHIRGAHYKPWTKRYLGYGDTLKPFQDKNPRRSWEICPGKTCLTLFEGRLWKCPPIAYLRLLQKKFDLSTEWAPYLSYTGLGAESSEEELKVFLNQEEEAICAMCPAQSEEFEKSNPMYPALRTESIQKGLKA
jgi:hypothetical protein